MDIVGGVVGSLCEACRHVARRAASGVRVNLLFDWEIDAVRVESPYTGGALRVTARRPGPLWVRLPPWVDRQRLEIGGAGPAVRQVADHLLFAEPPVGRPITIGFPLAEQDILLHQAGATIRARLRGDAVTRMDNLGTDLTFHEAWPKGPGVTS